MWIDKYGKSLVAALLAVVTAAHTYLADEVVTRQEWVQIAIAAVTAVSVWLVPALDYRWMKTAVAALLAGLNVLATLIVDGVTSADATEFVIAVLTVAAVGAAPARSDRTPAHDSPPPAV